MTACSAACRWPCLRMSLSRERWRLAASTPCTHAMPQPGPHRPACRLASGKPEPLCYRCRPYKAATQPFRQPVPR